LTSSNFKNKLNNLNINIYLEIMVSHLNPVEDVLSANLNSTNHIANYALALILDIVLENKKMKLVHNSLWG